MITNPIIPPAESLDEYIKKYNSSKIDVTIFMDLIPPKEQELFVKILKISSKYIDEDWYANTSIETLQQDIVVLQAIQIHLANLTSSLVSTATSCEDFLKTERSKVRLKAKQDKKALKLSEDVVKDISQVVTNTTFDDLRKITSAADFCRYMNYTTRDLIQLLEKALGRLFSLEKIRSTS